MRAGSWNVDMPIPGLFYLPYTMKYKLLLMVGALLMSYGMSGAQQKEKQPPTVYIIGDSTVKNGQDRGDRGQWGWGHFLALWMDLDKVSVENHAIGGRSSRSFLSEGRWEKIRSQLKEGDYVLIQFGHNDGGELNTGRARGSLKGTGEEYEDIIYSKPDQKELEGKSDRVYTYGHYLRRYIDDTRKAGATPVICSPVPRNRWKDGKILRDDSYALWAKEVAERKRVPFVDLGKAVADKYDILGEVLVKDYFSGDHTHTSLKGAWMNAETVIELIKGLKHCRLKTVLKN